MFLIFSSLGGIENDDDSIHPQTLAILMTAVVMLISSVAVYCMTFGGDKKPVAFHRDRDFERFPLIDRQVLSHDTRKFTFGFPSPEHRLGLPIGQHISFRFEEDVVEDDGTRTTRAHQRSYTPVTGNETLGHVSFVIKVYRANVHPKFPGGGKMSQHLDSLNIGDTMEMRGPKGHLDWHGITTASAAATGNFAIHPILKKNPIQERTVTHLNLICGGTGITPMYQILQAIFGPRMTSPSTTTTTTTDAANGSKADNTKITPIFVRMIYANQTEDDILLRSDLEGLAREFPSHFQLHYTLDRPPSSNWAGSTGFITKEMMEQHLYHPGVISSNGSVVVTQTFMCGPPPMIKFACLPNLAALGFSDKDWFVF